MRKILVLILMCSLGAPSVALAQNPAPAEAAAAQAKEQFKAGNFEAAAKLFMQAYAKSHTPALVYNAARAYEEAGKKGDAISLFKLYITLSDDAEGIQDARQRITKLEAPEAPKPVPLVIQPVVPPVLVTRPEPTRMSAWVTSGSAVAVLGAGVVLMVDGASGTTKYTGTDRASYDSAKAEWLVGAGLVGAGAVLGGVASYLWTRPVTLTPLSKGMAVTVAF